MNIPEDLAPDELTVENAEELFAKPSGDFELGKDPVTGHQIVAKDGRYGPYVTEILPEEAPPAEGKKKAKKGRGQAADRLAVQVDVPGHGDARGRAQADVAAAASGEIDGEEITAQNGRYGPYLKKGTDSRSLETEDQLFTITLEQAKEMFAQPKQRGRGRAAAEPPLRELGEDPVSEKPVVVKEGRFGPYVTDGETNATLRKGDEVEKITTERAAELLADRRARGPAPKRPTTARRPRLSERGRSQGLSGLSEKG